MSQTTRILRLTTIAVAGTLCLGGCLSKPISKEDAGKLVKLSAAFNRPKFVHVPRQITFQGYFYPTSYSSTASSEGGVLSISQLAGLDPTLAILKLNRAVSVSESIYGSGRDATHQVLVTPIAIDSASLLADEDPRSGAYDPQEELDAMEERRTGGSGGFAYSQLRKQIGWRVPIGTREFLQVDQIHNWRDANENIPVNELAVDFSWRWIPNENGDVFDTQSESFRSLPDDIQKAAEHAGIRMNTSGAMQSRAFLRREGKQWQLTVIQWSRGRGNPR